MELTITLALSILASVISVSTFVLNRKDKAIKDKDDMDKGKTEQTLIDYRLTKVEEKLDKILDYLNSYDKEIDERVEKALNNHVLLYHKGEWHGVERGYNRYERGSESSEKSKPSDGTLIRSKKNQ